MHKLQFFILACFFASYCFAKNNAIQADNSRSDSIDILNYSINLDITDFAGKKIKGNCVVTFTPKMNGMNTIDLDLLQLNVDSVQFNNQSTTFTYNDTLLKINFLSPLNIGNTATVNIYYQGSPKQDPSGFGGFSFSGNYAYNLGVGFWADPHNFGRVWFPCFDNFVERSTYDFFITTSMTNKAFCNGILQNVNDNGNGTQTWNWKMNQNIPTYLACVAVADYATVNLSHNGMNGTIPIIFAARAVDTTDMKKAFVNLGSAIDAFENAYGPYRWDKVGYSLVPFNGGAMEHATNIAYPRAVIPGGSTFYEASLMAHELSHHWWGDLATCETVEDMWLNEGWACYSEKIFTESVYGKPNYQQAIRINHEDVLHFTHITNGGYLPLSPVSHANTYNGDLVYQKGADVIHTLRGYMGDTLFFSCVKTFLNNHTFKTMNSYQLRDELSVCSGVNLTNYFNDWIFSPGFPQFSIDSFSAIADSGSGYDVIVYLRQKLKGATNYLSNVPLEINFRDANWNSITKSVSMNGICGYWTTSVPFNPIYIAVDFNEKISDAITDEWQIINTMGNKNFGTAKMILDVLSITDSALVRIEHSWVAPDRMKSPIAGLYLSTERYWKIDGINLGNIQADATISYDGKNGNLDNDLLFNNKPDSLAVMYRSSPAADWIIVDSFKINKLSILNKTGTVNIYNIQKGEYALAIFDALRNDTTTTPTGNCVQLYPTSIKSEIRNPKSEIVLYPNPTDNLVTVEINDSNSSSQITIYNLQGQLVLQQKISSNEKTIKIFTNQWQQGIYFMKFKKENAANEIKKLIVIH